MATCFNIFLDIYKANPLASFGFIGSHTIDKRTGKAEIKAQTKRFRVYRRAVFNYFGEQTFTHFENPENSVYIAISNKNKAVHKISDEANKILENLL